LQSILSYISSVDIPFSFGPKLLAIVRHPRQKYKEAFEKAVIKLFVSYTCQSHPVSQAVPNPSKSCIKRLVANEFCSHNANYYYQYPLPHGSACDFIDNSSD
jgi:hypothetical protein